MAEIVERQVCQSTQPWAAIYVNSHSTEGKKYRIYAAHPDDPEEELICECTGFLYRGTCSHQADGFAKLCRWSEHEGPEQQTPEQRTKAICPRCGEGTIRSNEWVA